MDILDCENSFPSDIPRDARLDLAPDCAAEGKVKKSTTSGGGFEIPLEGVDPNGGRCSPHHLMLSYCASFSFRS